MRVWLCSVLVMAHTVAAADDAITVRMESRADAPPEGWLHLDAAMPRFESASGGTVDGRVGILDLGSRARLAVEGTWWQTGLAPSMFATDLETSGWRAALEMSYDLGPFRVGMNASLSREGDRGHRMVGLFAYRTFQLSRWVRAWIVLGISLEEWELAGGDVRRRAGTVGLAIGGTFR